MRGKPVLTGPPSSRNFRFFLAQNHRLSLSLVSSSDHRGVAELARKASVGRSTLDALENGRIGELGFSKIAKILSALSMELKLQETGSRRPTLDELLQEDGNDQGPDQRR